MTSGLNANAMKIATAPMRRSWAGLNGIEARTRRRSLADGLEDGEDPSSRAESPTTARILDGSRKRVALTHLISSRHPRVVPPLEDEQGPQLLAVIAASVQVRSDELLDLGLKKEPVPPHARRR